MPPATISSGVSFQLRDLDTRHTTQTAAQCCHCSSPQQVQPWEPCCEKYLIDVQPIEHNCVSYITGMQYCNHAIQSLGILSWKASSIFVKVSVIIGRPVRFLCLPPNPQATSCLLILFHKTSSPLIGPHILLVTRWSRWHQQWVTSWPGCCEPGIMIMSHKKSRSEKLSFYALLSCSCR